MPDFHPPKTERDFALEQAQKNRPPEVTQAERDRMLASAMRLMHGLPAVSKQTPQEEIADEPGPRFDDLPAAASGGDSPQDDLAAGDGSAFGGGLLEDELADARSEPASWQRHWSGSLPPSEPDVDPPGSDSFAADDDLEPADTGLTGGLGSSSAFADPLHNDFLPGAFNTPAHAGYLPEVSDILPPSHQFDRAPSGGSFDDGRLPIRDLVFRSDEDRAASIQQLPYSPDRDGARAVQLADFLLSSEQASEPEPSTFQTASASAPATAVTRDEGPAMTRPILLISLLDVDALVQKQIEESATRLESVSREIVNYEINTLEFERAAQMRAIWGK